jgi:hypothetical protein
MEMDKNTKEDLKTVALGTSKINYLDPRITVAWCKRHEVPIEKVCRFRTLLAEVSYKEDTKLMNLFHSVFADRYSTNRFLRNSDGQWMLSRNLDSSSACCLVSQFNPASTPSPSH